MIKFRLLFFAFFLSLSAYSQFPNPGVEGFENTTGPETLPSTIWNLGTGVPGNQWAVFSNNIGSGRWTINSTVATPPLVCNGLNIAYMNRVQTGGAGLTSENYLATPRVTVPVNGQLRFVNRTFTPGNTGTFYDVKWAPSTANQTDPAAYTVTLATYTEDELTFDTYLGVQNLFNICTTKIINFPATLPAGTQGYIAFVRRNTQLAGTIDGDRWLLDDVQLNSRCLDPTSLAQSGLFFNGANLTWANPSGATSWEVEVLPAATPATGFGVLYSGTLPYFATTTSYGNPLTQTPLTPITPYKYYVRAVCPGSIPSNWVGPFNFTTTVAPPICGGNYVDAGGPTGNYPNNSTVANGTTVICPTVVGEQVTVTFTAFNTQANLDVMSIYDGNSSAAPLLGTFSGNTLPPTFTSSAIDGCLTFVFTSNGTTTNTGWLANVTCAPPPPCPRPTALTATSPTPTSINLGWTNIGPATSWQYIVLQCGSPAPTAASTGWVAATSNPVLINTGLASGTCYNVYVRGDCTSTSNGLSLWSNPVAITTLLGPQECGGNYVDTGGLTGNYNNNSTAANGTTTICAATPGDLVTVTFTAFSLENTFDILRIYDGPNATAPLLGSFTGNVNPGSFTGSSASGCLTFVFTSDGSVTATGWLANITCSPPPPCQKPTALAASSITSNSATISWTNVGVGTSWQVLAQPCAAPAPTAATTGWLPATGSPFVIPGLTPLTCYNIYVRSDCSSTSNGVSTWAGPVSITTPLAPPVCGGNFIDQAGPTANYANNSDSTVTICPTIAGQQVTVTFTSFNTQVNFDGLYVFDGNSIAATQIGSGNPSGNVPGGLAGAYWGTVIPGPFTGSSPNGCLTFRFRSDGTTTNLGWIANITCAPPPTCPKPTVVTISTITQNSATVAWTEMGTATQWHVLMLPSTDPIPNASTPGWQVANTNPYLYTPLNSGTQYKAYVRSFCSDSDISFWSNGTSFATLISNDECITAVNAPVNPDMVCTQIVGGTLIGATASSQPNTCAGTSDDDVWYSFVATTTAHSISLLNIAGSTLDLFHALYSGNCTTGLTQIYCSNPDLSTATNLVVGQTYYIRVYSFTAVTNQNTTFNVCIGTIPPPITTSTTLYTIPQLVEDVLFNSTCATITNVTSSTGTNFGSTNGISYFNQNGSSFPFTDGILLSTGNNARSPGPNNEGLSDGVNAWPGDTQLFNYIQGLGIDAGLNNYFNATKLEFDFVPLINSISFDFIFASEEYGTFQCAYSDAFAFFLTNNSTGVTTNLAVLPSSTIPISVVTIRDALYNTGCASANPQYFDNFYGALGLNPLSAPADYNGETVTLTATSTVVPGTQYHIKLVIADRNDNAFDSAVFLKGGSFNIGTVELGNDFLEANGNALCAGSSYTILSGLNPAQYTFTWTFNGVLIPNQTSPNLIVTQEGVYGINATFINTTCIAIDTIIIEFYDAVNSGTPSNMTVCNSSGFGQFNLSQNTPSALGSLSPTDYNVAYYLNTDDAEDELSFLPNLYTNVVQYLQTIYVRVENNTTGCFSIKPFNLIVQDLTPLFSITPDFSICNGANQTITVTPTNFNLTDVTFTWTLNGNAIAGSTNQIVADQNGTYIVTINNNGCTNTGQTVVTVIPFPIPDDPADVVACNNYTLPALTNGNYYTLTGGTGTQLVAGAVITASQTLYVYASTGSCTAENSFDILINPLVTPVFTQIGPLCINDTAPALPAASDNGGITGTWNPSTIDTSIVGTVTYTFTPDVAFCATQATMNITINPLTVPVFTQIAPICQGGNAPALPSTSTNNIIGVWNPATISTAIPGITTITFTPNSGQCANIVTMQITIHPTPVLASVSNVDDACNSYTLPTLEVGNYFSAPNGVSPITNLTLTSSQLVYVYAQSGTTPNCTDQESFQVTITNSPQFTIEGGCDGAVYVLEVTNANFNIDTADYSWSGPNGSVGTNSPILQVTASGVYTCVVSIPNGSEGGCSTSHTFDANDISCIVPKGISPNGDGLNDNFDLTGYNVGKLSIFNRFGTAVYTKNDYKDEWFGQSKSGNDLPDGTYYYVIERKDGGDTKTGWVFINREN